MIDIQEKNYGAVKMYMPAISMSLIKTAFCSAAAGGSQRYGLSTHPVMLLVIISSVIPAARTRGSHYQEIISF